MSPERVHALKDKRILVVGDIMLDHYIHGEVSKISPEAPVPIVLKTSDDYSLGGAANVAHAVRALGATAIVCGLVGEDDGYRILSGLLENVGIPRTGLIQSRRKKTSIKQRIVAHGHHMLRVDFEDTSPLDEREHAALQSIMETVMPGIDCVVLSDYAKGVFTPSLASAIMLCAKKYGKKVVADFKPQNKDFFYGCDVIVPNLREALAIASAPDLASAGARLVEDYKTDVIITRGSDGMSIFHLDGRRSDIASKAVRICDVTGAGDTVAAILALGLSVGLPLTEAADLANCGAGLVVQKQGTSTVSLDELLSAIGTRKHINDVARVPKVWGYERWLENSEKYCAKLLSLNRGYQCSLHYHQHKDETFLILKGVVRIEVRDTVHTMREGNYIRIHPGTLHRFTGIEDALILEISTIHEEDDSYRIEESRELPVEEFDRVMTFVRDPHHTPEEVLDSMAK